LELCSLEFLIISANLSYLIDRFFFYSWPT